MFKKTSLHKVVATVKFKKLVEQLTREEFARFITTVSKECDMEIIMGLLCGQFPIANSNAALIKQMIGIITTIVGNRGKHDISKASKMDRIDELAYSLISHIASYLNQKDYALFSQSN